MKHSYFDIRNFKGIDNVRLDLTTKPKGQVYTLVGLNESGKTTVLEAIHFFEVAAQPENPLELHGYTISDVHKLIPISKRSNFNGEIAIEAGYRLEDDDKAHIEKFLWESYRFEIKKPLQNEFYIRRAYGFKNSNLLPNMPTLTWSFKVWGKTTKGKNEKYMEGEKAAELYRFVKNMLPSIQYFPNFLFEFPDRIYLNNPPKNTPKEIQKHRYYTEVLEDVLHAVDPDASLEEHVIKRIGVDRGWLSWDSETLESVLAKMGSHITRTVFNQWNRIFERESSGKTIVLAAGREPAVESEADGRPYVQLRLRDGSEQYAISERSLGFRWFFSFLLFTQYRDFRNQTIRRNILFLLDEPASNLHSSAQQQLLDSFAKFPENSTVIYTTHSQYLINPNWLENAFVVKNDGLAYDQSDEDFDAANTRVSVHRYREYVSSHPDQTTYFQPILDVLNYCPSRLENVPDVLMLEGKNDFYTLNMIWELVLKGKPALNLMPGGGAGSLDNAIQLYLAWGRDFVVLLDSDAAGTTQKNRYIEKFGDLVRNKIFQLSDIDPEWKKLGTERLFDDSEKLKIQQHAYPETTEYNKKHFNRSVQEALLARSIPTLSAETISRFQRLFAFFADHLTKPQVKGAAS